MKLLKRIVVTLISIILVLLVTFNVYNFVCIQLLHKDLAMIGKYSLLEVVSGSMEPTIMVGDFIIIDTDWKNYEKNDIITFRDVNDAFVTHRILEIDNENKVMITQGDANQSRDEELSTDRIVGKYVFRLPGVGKVMSSLRNPLVMILILVIGVIICVLASTDGDMVPKDLKDKALTDEEKEFLEFKRQKEEMKKREALQEKEEIIEEKTVKKKSKSKDDNTKEATLKKTTKKVVKEEPKKEPAKKASSTSTNKKVQTSSKTKKTTKK